MSPGWYPDDQGRPLQHYWDGWRWTGQTQPVGIVYVKSRGGAANTLAGLILTLLAIGGILVLAVFLYFMAR